MTTAQADQPTGSKPLRLWPGVVLVALQWVLRFVVPAVFPAAAMAGILGGLLAGVAVVVWWMFFSRAPWSERLTVAAVIALALVATPYVLHESIAGGMMGMMFYIYVIPGLCLALVAWAVMSRRLSSGLRRASMVGAILLACGVWTLTRTEGMDGEGRSDLEWRWTATHEERLLAERGAELARLPPPVAPADASRRGPDAVPGEVPAAPALPGEAAGAEVAPAIAPPPAGVAEVAAPAAPAVAPAPDAV